MPLRTLALSNCPPSMGMFKDRNFKLNQMIVAYFRVLCEFERSLIYETFLLKCGLHLSLDFAIMPLLIRVSINKIFVLFDYYGTISWVMVWRSYICQQGLFIHFLALLVVSKLPFKVRHIQIDWFSSLWLFLNGNEFICAEISYIYIEGKSTEMDGSWMIVLAVGVGMFDFMSSLDNMFRIHLIIIMQSPPVAVCWFLLIWWIQGSVYFGLIDGFIYW